MKVTLAPTLLSVASALLLYLAWNFGSSPAVIVAAPSAPADKLTKSAVHPQLTLDIKSDPFRLARPRSGSRAGTSGSRSSAGSGPAIVPTNLEAVLISDGLRSAVIDGHVRVEGRPWQTPSGVARLIRVVPKGVSIELGDKVIELQLISAEASTTPSAGAKGSKPSGRRQS